MSFPSIGAALGPLIGTAASNAASANQAKQQRRFIERMRSTAYQATMADMREAGLNPILAYKTGPTPIGSAAMGQTMDFGQALASGVNAATKVFEAKASRTKKRAEGGRAFADRQLRNEQTTNAILQGKNIAADTALKTEQAGDTSASRMLKEATLPKAEAIKAMDESAAGQVLIQGTTAIKRATGAVPIPRRR